MNLLSQKFNNRQYLKNQFFKGFDTDFLNNSDIESFQKAIQQKSNFISIENCKYLYRACSFKELKLIIDNQIIRNNRKLLGFSFSKEKIFSGFAANVLQHNGIILTFDAQIMRDNFQFIDVIPSLKWLENNIPVALHIRGLESDVFETTKAFSNEFIYSDLTRNKEIQEWVQEHKNDYNYEEECFRLLYFTIDPKRAKNLLLASSINETILVGDYKFITGMIVDIQCSDEKDIERLYVYIQENQDTLNLEL
jgi:hypothetical protein